MPRTTLTAQAVPNAGLNPSLAAANADGHAVRFSPGLLVEVDNANASPITVTIPSTQTVDGLAVASRTVTVTNGQRRFIKAFGPHQLQGDGTVHLNFSAVADITVGAFE